MKAQLLSALKIHRFENWIDYLIDFRMVRGVLDVRGSVCPTHVASIRLVISLLNSKTASGCY